MSTLTHHVSDSMTMLRRNLTHALRYPAMTFSVALMPVTMLLLFDYAFGGALGAGISVAPGIILMAATAGAVMTAVGVCVDLTEGIVNRFRTISISRAAFLTGHVAGSVLQTPVAVAPVIGVAPAIGFRPDASLVEWIAAVGLLTPLVLARTWPAAAMGLVARTPESASNAPLPLTFLPFLPFLGSAVVPTDEELSGRSCDCRLVGRRSTSAIGSGPPTAPGNVCCNRSRPRPTRPARSIGTSRWTPPSCAPTSTRTATVARCP
nr:ABC transporter permease [Streptomyces sp. ISL-36]